jgi:hypothetical protein
MHAEDAKTAGALSGTLRLSLLAAVPIRAASSRVTTAAPCRMHCVALHCGCANCFDLSVGQVWVGVNLRGAKLPAYVGQYIRVRVVPRASFGRAQLRISQTCMSHFTASIVRCRAFELAAAASEKLDAILADTAMVIALALARDLARELTTLSFTVAQGRE